MDLYELLHDHQVEVMKASGSGDDAGEKGHFAKVALDAEKIRELRGKRQGPEPRPVTDSRKTIIYGTYAGEPSPAESGPATALESVGCYLDPVEIPLPSSVTSKALNQYYVGTYTYTDLTLALAEHARQKRDGDVL